MINMDDPRHARLRRIVSRGFTPRVLAALRGRRAAHRRRDRRRRDAEGRVRLRHRDRRGAAAPDHLRHDGHPREPAPVRVRPHERDPRRGRPRVHARARPGEDHPGAAHGRAPSSSSSCRTSARHRRAQPGRRPDLGARERRGRRRAARPTPELGSFFVLLVVGRQRDHAQRHQPRHEGALRPPRAARALGGRLRRRRADRRRGDRALGDAGDPLPPHRDPRHRARAASRSAPATRCVLWYCSANRDEDVFDDPFRFDVRRDAERARRLRRPGPALLPRRAPRAARDHGDVPRALPAPAGPRDHRARPSGSSPSSSTASSTCRARSGRPGGGRGSRATPSRADHEQRHRPRRGRRCAKRSINENPWSARCSSARGTATASAGEDEARGPRLAQRPHERRRREDRQRDRRRRAHPEARRRRSSGGSEERVVAVSGSGMCAEAGGEVQPDAPRERAGSRALLPLVGREHEALGQVRRHELEDTRSRRGRSPR